MTEPHLFAGALLERGASGYAGMAASLMLERYPQASTENTSHEVWKQHITQRVLELSAALNVGEPELFTNRATWFRKALKARNVDESFVNASLLCLRDTLEERLPEAGRNAPVQYINLALSALDNEVGSLEDSELNPESETDKLALQYLQGVLEGNSAKAINELLEELKSGRDAPTLYTDVLMPAQREIGRLWHVGDATVAEEHLVTAATQKAMAVISQVAPSKPECGRTVIAASVANNAHDIGIRAIADMFQLEGWRVIYLGSDVPVEDLPVMIGYFDAELLVLSATLDTQITNVKTAVEAVRSRTENPVRILVGGYAFDQAPELASTVGADAYTATAQDAIAKGIELATH